MTSILNKRASGHPTHCEDSYFLYEDDVKIVGAVLDGCSTGINSHFASQFFAYALERYSVQSVGFDHYLAPPSKWEIFERVMFNDISDRMWNISATLGLTRMHFLSTIVYFVHLKRERELHVTFFGDGVVYVNGERFTNEENNMPDYFAYHVSNDLDTYVASRPRRVFSDVSDFSICTDGIDSFVNLRDGHLDRSIPVDFLVRDTRSINLKNGLNKKFNILTNRSEDIKLSDEHWWWDIQDDLTIIRYVDGI